ncbi:hypothetical protein SteCoe_36831 [Stentor coeruleus]|uniref:Uncharacterized protein n=1 Tax=Stentor coeruleus TaxID=5963 RepID=A0A1R2AP81_9CILI|nr:hypothetical protein SteCoe_36831 [Stentor coeruleus]
MSISNLKISGLKSSSFHTNFEEESYSEDFKESSIKNPMQTSSYKSIPSISNLKSSLPQSKYPIPKQTSQTSLIKSQGQSFQSLTKIHANPESKAYVYDPKPSIHREVQYFINEKESQIKSLGIPLDLANEELGISINSTQENSIITKSTVFANEFYLKNRPKRVWNCEENVGKINNPKPNTLQSMLKAHRRIVTSG